jgi:hypothetical protein
MALEISLDNTQKVVSFLDIHMIHPLLDYLRDVRPLPFPIPHSFSFFMSLISLDIFACL